MKQTESDLELPSNRSADALAFGIQINKDVAISSDHFQINHVASARSNNALWAVLPILI